MRGHTITRARALRRESTDAERKLWWLLRDRRLLGLKFRRQHPIGPFFADFACPERKLIIELDGGQHIDDARYDSRRTACLEAAGWSVLRFWDDDVLLEVDDVLEAILNAVNRTPHPNPLPAGRERES